MWKAFLIFVFFPGIASANNCLPYYDSDERLVACVCNSTYCDYVPDDQTKTPKGTFKLFVSNKAGKRLQMSSGKLNEIDTVNQCSKDYLIVDSSRKYQKIVGFGGAFTDAFGIDLKTLSPEVQDQLIRSYYDRKVGSRYNLGRVAIAGTDFSTRPYTYDEHPLDTSLKHFALTKEDYEYKLPVIKEALKLNPNTKLITAAWTAPTWMKTNKKYNGFGFLKKEYYQAYANYLLKFLDEYKKNGVSIWAITSNNEPTNVYRPDFPLTTMGWRSPEEMAKWVADHMGPSLASSQHNETLLLLLDDNRNVLPWSVSPTFTDPKASKYAAGTAVHFYSDATMPAEVLNWLHDSFPDKIIIMTEASIGPISWGTRNAATELWSRGETYASSIIEYMNHWAVGFVDWNLALDEKGGPNWLGNLVDAAIVVNGKKDEFYKTAIYYAMTHVSRFVDRNSYRVSITGTKAIQSAAFETPTQQTVVVLLNRNNSTRSVILNDLDKGEMQFELSPNSINTLIY